MVADDPELFETVGAVVSAMSCSTRVALALSVMAPARPSKRMETAWSLVSTNAEIVVNSLVGNATNPPPVARTMVND